LLSNLGMGDVTVVMGSIRPALEFLAMGAICGALVLVVLGPSFMTFARTIAVGIAGIAVGWGLWLTMGWPLGFVVEGFPILPSLLGTVAVTLAAGLAVRLYDETMRYRQAKTRQAALPAAPLTESRPPVVLAANQHLEPREAPADRSAAR
jgi:hypothetical protein